MNPYLARCVAPALALALAPAALAATFTVTNTNDVGPGSLRDAINQANTAAGADLIDFNIPAPGGLATIQPLSPLPPLTDQAGVVIDGFTQPGAAAGANPPATITIKVELDGSLVPPPAATPPFAHGIHIISSHNVIRGLAVHGFPHDGISIQAMRQDLGGANDNLIEHNLVGTDVSGGLPRPNCHGPGGLWAGIYVKVVPNSQPPAVAYRNIIRQNLSSGNQGEGIGIASCPDCGDTAFNEVLGNHVGTEIRGLLPMLPVGNLRTGVYIGEGAHHNLVGEDAAGSQHPNTICFNGFEGVSIVGYAEAEPMPWYTDDNLVRWNRIGVNVNLTPLGNMLSGVAIGAYGAQNYGGAGWYMGGHARRNRVQDNTIAFNQRCGVIVWEWRQPENLRPDNASFNTIIHNSIYENGTIDPGYLGIDLQFDGVTANDLLPGPDSDSGPNRFVNFTNDGMTVVYLGGGSAGVSGKIQIDSNPSNASVEVFRAAPDTTGPPYATSPHGEGAVFLGIAVPAADGSWSVIVTGVAPGDSITATTTDTFGNTSEFAENVVVVGEDKVDYGDARDLTYPTLNARNGARHVIHPQWFLGAAVDGESDGKPNSTASGDDNDGVDDEDGVVFHPMIPGHMSQIDVYPSQQGRIDAWIDFNADGDWNDPGEQIAASALVNPHVTTIGFKVPATAAPCTNTFARVRFSSTGGLTTTGTATDGEVEDYLMPIGKKIVVAVQVTPTGVPATVTLQWAADPAATQYSVYSSLNLAGSFPAGWTLEQTGIAATTWIEAYVPPDKFYIVVALP